MIGEFEAEIDAVKAHDLFAIEKWGESTLTNFPVCIYIIMILIYISTCNELLFFENNAKYFFR